MAANWDYEKVVRELSDTMTVVVGIQAKQASLLKDQALWMESVQKSHTKQQERIDHIEEALAEIGDKLNGLIGYVDGQHKPSAE